MDANELIAGTGNTCLKWPLIYRFDKRVTRKISRFIAAVIGNSLPGRVEPWPFSSSRPPLLAVSKGPRFVKPIQIRRRKRGSRISSLWALPRLHVVVWSRLQLTFVQRYYVLSPLPPWKMSGDETATIFLPEISIVIIIGVRVIICRGGRW